MRPPIDAGPPAWPMRIFRPWLVATASGLAIGTALLRFEPAEVSSSYPELAPRAAVYDMPAFDPALSSSAPAGPASTSLGNIPPAGSLFDPAAPIAASAELSPDEVSLP